MDFIVGDSYRLQLRLDVPAANTGSVRSAEYLGDFELWLPNDPANSIMSPVPVFVDWDNKRIVPLCRHDVVSAEPLARRWRTPFDGREAPAVKGE